MIAPRSGGAGVLRFREGDVTITLDGQLEAWVRRVLDGSAGVAVRAMEAEAQEVADRARMNWYGQAGVEWQTGKGGDIQVVTTVSESEVKVGIGSTDDRRQSGRFVAMFVHRPGRFSLVRKEVDNATWWATPPEMRANYKPRGAAKYSKSDSPADPPGSGPYIYVLNKKASDGKNLMNEFVRRPMQAKIADMPKRLQDALGTLLRGR